MKLYFYGLVSAVVLAAVGFGGYEAYRIREAAKRADAMYQFLTESLGEITDKEGKKQPVPRSAVLETLIQERIAVVQQQQQAAPEGKK